MIGRHLFIPLDTTNHHYYASCNILNDDGLVYVYLLHPQKGSMLFTLNFSETYSEYKPRYTTPGLDKATVKLINRKLLCDCDHGDLTFYAANYQLYVAEKDYEYYAVNRIYRSKENIITLTNIFHIFHENWKSSNEYQWNMDTGLIEPQARELSRAAMKVIGNIIIRMNELL